MASGTLAQQVIEEHQVGGRLERGHSVAIRIDQTLTQDATGTLVMLELEAMGLDRVRTEISVQYVDHNLLQSDYRNADDHVFLESACRKFGIWYSRPGNGVSHPVHMANFGAPGRTLVGSDSHSSAAGALGMLGVGVGGLEVALAMAGEPLWLRTPRIRRVWLEGQLPSWVSAKDVILELLRRHGVDGGTGWVLEYDGPGLEALSAMDRHVLANMGAELGATTSIFPSDERTRAFLERQGRPEAWRPLRASDQARYDAETEIDLTGLQPLIALPSSPGNVVPVREVAGRPIYQAYLGSSANPGLRDFAVPARMVADRTVAPTVSFDVNPSSRQVLEQLTASGDLARLIQAGARIHQAGCNGCIGMGQAPATGRNSLRTVPRNFPGRSGTPEDSVYLCSPETATASALTGEITDPRDLGHDPPVYHEPDTAPRHPELFIHPIEGNGEVELVKGPNIHSLPPLDPLPSQLRGPVLLKVGDDVSTDEILPAGTAVLPLRSNIQEISRFAFRPIDPSYPTRAEELERGVHFVVAGSNYGQGSSREHAALAPRYLGLRVVIARGFARIHAQNLANFGIVPLTFADPDDYDRLEAAEELVVRNVRSALRDGAAVIVERSRTGDTVETNHALTDRQIEDLLAGGTLRRWS